jgi:ubiquinone/menaquinone biosynthesis C-methylase UbiE
MRISDGFMVITDLKRVISRRVRICIITFSFPYPGNVERNVIDIWMNPIQPAIRANKRKRCEKLKFKQTHSNDEWAIQTGCHHMASSDRLVSGDQWYKLIKSCAKVTDLIRIFDDCMLVSFKCLSNRGNVQMSVSVE